jgi:cytidylate kinase
VSLRPAPAGDHPRPPGVPGAGRPVAAAPLPHVLWLGGPPCSGKTSIALLLAGRHDLRAYNSDLHTWEHHDRAVERGWTAGTFWETATPDELWLADPDEIVRRTLAANAERCRLMLEDIEALPDSPLVVAEGTPLLPWLVADRVADSGHAVWLVPPPEFQRARLLERPRIAFERTSDPERALENRIRRELAVGELIESDAWERGFQVIRVDESQGLLEVAAQVEEVFGEAIAAGPRASTRAERVELRRRHNRQVHRQVSAYFARVPGAGGPGASPVPFGCECGASGCLGLTSATLDAATEVFAGGTRLLADGHEAA